MGRRRNPVVFKMAEQFTIKNMSQFHNDFIKAVSEERAIVVDLAETDTIDFSGLQLLYSLKRTCEKSNLDLSLENIKESIIGKIKLCGLQNYLLKETPDGSV